MPRKSSTEPAAETRRTRSRVRAVAEVDVPPAEPTARGRSRGARASKASASPSVSPSSSRKASPSPSPKPTKRGKRGAAEPSPELSAKTETPTRGRRGRQQKSEEEENVEEVAAEEVEEEEEPVAPVKKTPTPKGRRSRGKPALDTSEVADDEEVLTKTTPQARARGRGRKTAEETTSEEATASEEASSQESAAEVVSPSKGRRGRGGRRSEPAQAKEIVESEETEEVAESEDKPEVPVEVEAESVELAEPVTPKGGRRGRAAKATPSPASGRGRRGRAAAKPDLEEAEEGTEVAEAEEQPTTSRPRRSRGSPKTPVESPTRKRTPRGAAKQAEALIAATMETDRVGEEPEEEESEEPLSPKSRKRKHEEVADVEEQSSPLKRARTSDGVVDEPVVEEMDVEQGSKEAEADKLQPQNVEIAEPAAAVIKAAEQKAVEQPPAEIAAVVMDDEEPEVLELLPEDRVPVAVENISEDEAMADVQGLPEPVQQVVKEPAPIQILAPKPVPELVKEPVAEVISDEPDEESVEEISEPENDVLPTTTIQRDVQEIVNIDKGLTAAAPVVIADEAGDDSVVQFEGFQPGPAAKEIHDVVQVEGFETTAEVKRAEPVAKEIVNIEEDIVATSSVTREQDTDPAKDYVVVQMEDVPASDSAEISRSLPPIHQRDESSSLGDVILEAPPSTDQSNCVTVVAPDSDHVSAVNGERREFQDTLLSRKFIANREIDSVSYDPTKKFSIVSYNIAASVPSSQGPDFRHKRFLKEIQYLDADVACLQDVDKDYFSGSLQPTMRGLGYEGVFQKLATPDSNQGVATFYRTSRFSLLDHKGVPIKFLICQNIESSSQNDDEKKAIFQFVNDPSVLLTARLQCNLKGSVVTVGNTNLLSTPTEKPNLQCIQVAYAVKELVNQAGSPYNPHMLCSDLNANPESATYQLTREGYLNDQAMTTLQAATNIVLPEGQRKSLVNLWWSAFQHTSSNLRSVYAMVQNSDPVTSFSPTGESTARDFIWYSGESLMPLGVLGVNPSESRKTTIADETFPSSHMSLKAEVGFK